MIKKINLLLILVILSGSVVFAQGTLGKGGKQLNAGLGFSNWGVPVYVGLDFGVHESITIGPKFSYRNYSYTVQGTPVKQSLAVFSFNGNYHFNKVLSLPKELDIYAGVTLGYYLWTDTKFVINGVTYYGSQSSAVGWDAQLGIRYFISNNFGLNLEFGGGTATGGGFGITYKF